MMSLLFNELSRFVIAFLSRSKHLFISWRQSPLAVILEPKKMKSVTISIVSPSICVKWWDWIPWSSFFECWVLSQIFHPLLYFHQEALQFLFTFYHKRGVICISEVVYILLIFLLAILILACDLSSPAFHMMYSAYKLNKQGHNIQPCRIPVYDWSNMTNLFFTTA